MSQSYTDPRHWEEVHGLPAIGQCVWSYLLTHRYTLVPGLLRIGVAGLCEELGLPLSEINDGITILKNAGKLQYDPAVLMFRLPRAPMYCPKGGPTNISGWYRHWLTMSECSLKHEHVTSLRNAVDLTRKGVLETWSETFGRVEHEQKPPIVSDQTQLLFSQSSSLFGSPIPSPIDAPSIREKKKKRQKQDQRKSKKQKQSGSGAPPNPEIKIAIDGFDAMFREHRQADTLWTPREIARMGKLVLAAKGAAEVLRRARIMFESAPAWPADGGGDLDTLARHFNRFANAPPKAKRSGRVEPAVAPPGLVAGEKFFDT